MRTGIGLIRVSKDRDNLISPDLQRRAIVTYAERAEIHIAAWREAVDESGSQTRSPWWATLDKIITEVEQGQFQAVVAWKFNRAARHRLKWAVALDRIEQAGATLESATESVDTTTSTGRFTRGMLAELAAFESERISEGWKEAKARRRSLGLGDGGFRFGYDIVDKRYVPGAHAGLLRGAYEQAASGGSLITIAQWLNDRGAVTKYGNPYAPYYIGLMLDSGFGAGLIRHNDTYLPGVHEPVIDSGLWERYLAARKHTVEYPVRHGKHDLSGLLWCVYCKSVLHAAHRQGWPAGTRWRCQQTVCSGTFGWGPVVNRMIDDWLDLILAGKDDTYQQALGKAVKPPLRSQRRLARVEESLLSIARKNESGFYDDDTYLRLRAELLDERRLLRKELDDTPTQMPLSVIADMRSTTGLERNEALKRVIARVEVRKREGPKYLIVPLWSVT